MALLTTLHTSFVRTNRIVRNRKRNNRITKGKEIERIEQMKFVGLRQNHY